MRLLALLLGALLLAGCGAAQSSQEPVNADDVMFLQMMLPHHRQGIEMAKLARTRAKSPELKTLAAAIEATQTDEVTTMNRWLMEWDQPLTAPSESHAHHGGLKETDRKQIAALRTSKRFDRDLINLLVAHQDDAVQMATAEAGQGASPKVKEWARQVEASRKAQIKLLLDLGKR